MPMTIHDGTAASAPVETTVIDTAPPVPPPRSIPAGERSLAPDIARGLLLMFIAIANIPGFHLGYPEHELDPSPLDLAVRAVESTFVVDRTRPMFAVLFGFGMAVMASRMAARGTDAKGVRRVLRRRALWLMLFGLIHATFLWHGDILGPYGATALVALFLVNRSDRVLRRWFWASLVVMSVGYVLAIIGFSNDSGPREGHVLTYPSFMVDGLVGDALIQALSLVLLLFVPLVVVGFWLFRSGWLTHPQDHLPQLRRVFWTAMAANVVLSVPAVLESTEVIDLKGVALAVGATFEVIVGAGTGVGYVCGFAILAARWADRGRTGLPGVLAAVGERSLTAYLSQSVLFFAVVTGYGLGLGAHLGDTGDLVTAVAGWAVIAVGMVLLARHGRRGPFDVLIRRLTYRAARSERRARAGAGAGTGGEQALRSEA